jgi:hypothetical protein
VRRTPLLVAAVLVLAGCSGFTGGDESTPTLTPAERPETASYPPGVAADGVVSPDALADAHEDRDDNRSYTLVSNRTVEYANGTVRSAIHTRIDLAENRSYLATVSTNGSRGPVLLGRPPAAATFWSDGETYARELTRDGATTYNTFTPPDQYAGTWRFWTRTVAFGGRSGFAGQTIRQTFRAVPTTLVGQESVDGTTYYRLRGDEATSTEFAAPEIDSVSNLTFAATVDRDGLVRRIHYRFDGRIDGLPVRVERTIAYEDVDETTVGKPGWLGRALNASQ